MPLYRGATRLAQTRRHGALRRQDSGARPRMRRCGTAILDPVDVGRLREVTETDINDEDRQDTGVHFLVMCQKQVEHRIQWSVS